MKKVLVISGSPRKRGNTISIVNMLESLIKKEDENVAFNNLYLIDKQLKWCRGCWHLNCLNKGGIYCLLKDDSVAIKKEIDPVKKNRVMIIPVMGGVFQCSGLL